MKYMGEIGLQFVKINITKSRAKPVKEKHVINKYKISQIR